MTNSKSKISTSDIARCGLCTAVIVICSWIQIPSSVPFTLQTFGVFLTVGLLGGKLGTISVLAYIILGACGLPVFAGFSSGIGVIMGTTGGYLFGFIASALIMWLFEKLCGKNYKNPIIMITSMIVGLIILYIIGTAWFMMVYLKNTGSVGLGQVLTWCVIPFIIPDVLKILCASVIIKGVKKYVSA